MIALYEKGKLFGHVRLSLAGELAHVEIKRVEEPEWKPFCSLLVIESRVAFRMYGNATKEGVYDPATNKVITGEGPRG